MKTVYMKRVQGIEIESTETTHIQWCYECGTYFFQDQESNIATDYT